MILPDRDATILGMANRKRAASLLQKPARSVRKTAKKGVHDAPHPPELVIITGMSGSGKASVLKAFEAWLGN